MACKGSGVQNPLSSTTTTPHASITARYLLIPAESASVGWGRERLERHAQTLINSGQDASLHLGPQILLDGPHGARATLAAGRSGGPVAQQFIDHPYRNIGILQVAKVCRRPYGAFRLQPIPGWPAAAAWDGRYSLARPAYWWGRVAPVQQVKVYPAASSNGM
jgi:hypothetical protein